MSINVYTTGDDLAIPVTLKLDSTPIKIDTGATVKAAFVERGGSELISPIVTCSPTASGADWLNGRVIVEMTSAETAQITASGIAKLEIEVDDTVNSSGKSTWRGVVMIEKGNV